MVSPELPTICTHSFFARHKGGEAAVLLEIFNGMDVPYVGIRLNRGFRITVALSNKEVAQLGDIGFFPVKEIKEGAAKQQN